ncbi:MAG: AAA family ATPase [Planctomycetota bacterium]
MYEQVFNFRSRPFTTTPFVKHYFAGSTIQQSLGQAQLCIDRASGPVVLVGDIGTGKSLFLAMLEHQYKSQFLTVNLGCARLENRKDLLQSILFALNRPIIGRTESELRFDLMAQVKPNPKCPDGMLLLVDDADTLSIDLIDELRLITNYVVDGAPRVRLVMAGRQGLEEQLTNPKIASFVQRIATRCYLSPLTGSETSSYIQEHINRAGGSAEDLFPVESCQKLFELTEGVPRLINQVADFALIISGTRGESSVSGEIIEEAWADVQSMPGMALAADGNQETNSDWTVIEFGQLEEESDGTVYEFGTSVSETQASAESFGQLEQPEITSTVPAAESNEAEPVSSLNSEVDEIGEAVGAEANQQQATLEHPTTTEPTQPAAPAYQSPFLDDDGERVFSPMGNADDLKRPLEHQDAVETVEPVAPAQVDPELGIDLAALQRQQAALAATNEAVSDETSQLDPTSAAASEFVDSESDQTGIQNAESSATAEPSVDLAAQFAAVFGKEPAPFSPPTEEPSDLPVDDPVQGNELPAASWQAASDSTELSEQEQIEQLQQDQDSLFAMADQERPAASNPLGLDAQPRESDAGLPPMNVADFVRPATTTNIANEIANAFEAASSQESPNLDAPQAASSQSSPKIHAEAQSQASDDTSADPELTKQDLGVDFSALSASLEAARAFDVKNVEETERRVEELQQLESPTESSSSETEKTPATDAIEKSSVAGSASQYEFVQQDVPSEEWANPTSESASNWQMNDENGVSSEAAANEPAVETSFEQASAEPEMNSFQLPGNPETEAEVTSNNSIVDDSAIEISETKSEEVCANQNDPFAESFEQEETLLDRFAPIIAAQNHSSAALTSSDLQNVRPTDPVSEPAVPPSPEPSVHASTDSPFEAFNPIDFSSIQSDESENQNVVESGPVDHDSSSAESAVPDIQPTPELEPHEASSDQSEHADSVSPSPTIYDQPTEVNEEQRARGYAVVRPATQELSDDETEPSMQSSAPTALETQSSSLEPSPSTTDAGEVHRHVTEAANDDISRQAEAILRRLEANQKSQQLAASSPVSHETGVNTNLEEIQNSPQLFESDASSSLSEQDPSEAILNEIHQQREIIQQHDGSELETLSSFDDSAASQMSTIDYPLRDQEANAGSRNDDGEMLFVSRDPSKSVPSAPERPSIPLPETPVSTGRAERMDYQRLFDQLRDVNKEDSHE